MTDSPFPAPSPDEVVTVADAPSPPRRRRTAPAIAAVIGIGAAVALVAVVARSGDDATGASSPTDAVERFASAVDAEDFIGALDVVAPDEIDGLKPLIDTIRARADDPGLGGAFDPSNFGGVLGRPPTTVTTAAGEAPTKSVDLSVTLEDVVESPLGVHVAAVDAQVTASADVSGFDLSGAIDDVTGSEDVPPSQTPTARFDLRVITVQLDGAWYVSPMLTGAEAAAENGDMPDPDWSKVDAAPPTTKAGSPTEAVEAAARAIATQDLDAMIDVMGPGEARVLRVFRGAAEQLLSDVDVVVTVNDVAATASGDGAVLSLLDLTVVDPDGESHHGHYADGCLQVDDEPEDCLVPADGSNPFGITPDDLVWKVVTADGNARVSVLGSLFGFVEHVISTVTDQQLLDALGLQYLDEATTVEVDTAVKGATTSEQPYAVYEFTAEEQTAYDPQIDSGDVYCYGETYRQSNGSFAPEWLVADYPAGLARVVVSCDEPTAFTLTLTPAAVEPGQFPGGDGGFDPGQVEARTIDLAGGEQIVEFDAPAGVFVDISVESKGADITLSASECADCGVVDFDTTAAGNFEFISWLTETDGTHQLVITPKPGADADATAEVTISRFSE